MATTTLTPSGLPGQPYGSFLGKEQSAEPVVVVPQGRLNLGRGGGGYKEKEEWYRRMTQDLLQRFHALQRRTLPPPETPVEQPKPEKVLEPYTKAVEELKAKPDARIKQIETLEKDGRVLRKRIEKELERKQKEKWILKMDEEAVKIALMLDD